VILLEFHRSQRSPNSRFYFVGFSNYVLIRFIQFRLPSFTLPSFGKDWAVSLFGRAHSSDILSLPEGEKASFSLPSLGFDLDLLPTGSIQLSSPSFSLNLSPMGLPSASKSELIKGPSFSVIRNDKWEFGVGVRENLLKPFLILLKDLPARSVSFDIKVLYAFS
jgi:hypothetical protein